MRPEAGSVKIPVRSASFPNLDHGACRRRVEIPPTLQTPPSADFSKVAGDFFVHDFIISSLR